MPLLWMSGVVAHPVREWLHVDDGAQAMIRSIDVAPCIDPINIGVAKGISVLAMAELIGDIVGYKGEIKLDPSKPDGAPYKTVDGSKGEQHFAWSPAIDFKQGVAETIEWYLQNH